MTTAIELLRERNVERIAVGILVVVDAFRVCEPDMNSGADQSLHVFRQDLTGDSD